MTRRSRIPIEFSNTQAGFRYRLGVSVSGWCMGVISALIFVWMVPNRVEILNIIITPTMTLLGAVVLGLLGIKGYQDWSASKQSETRSFDRERYRRPAPPAASADDDDHDQPKGGRSD